MSPPLRRAHRVGGGRHTPGLHGLPGDRAPKIGWNEECEVRPRSRARRPAWDRSGACRGYRLDEREGPVRVDRDLQVAGGAIEYDRGAALFSDAVDGAVPVVPETEVIGK